MANAKPPSPSKRRRHGSCQLFYNFITCRWSTDTNINDSVLNPSVERSYKSTPEKFSNEEEKECRAIIKVDKLGEHQTWNSSRNGARNNSDGTTKSNSDCWARNSTAASIQLKGPTCSQCGKHFKPEKLHKHLQSCKGMKAIAKDSHRVSIPTIITENQAQNTEEPSQKKSVSATYLLSDFLLNSNSFL